MATIVELILRRNTYSTLFTDQICFCFIESEVGSVIDVVAAVVVAAIVVAAVLNVVAVAVVDAKKPVGRSPSRHKSLSLEANKNISDGDGTFL